MTLPILQRKSTPYRVIRGTSTRDVIQLGILCESVTFGLVVGQYRRFTGVSIHSFVEGWIVKELRGGMF